METEENALLNDQQIEAIKHLNGPCMVYAGPGSGKTRVITERVSYLINVGHVNPREILVITFTKAAAEEMKNRFAKDESVEDSKKRQVTFGTFHSIFFRMLKSYCGYNLENILNEGEKFNVIKNIVRTLDVGNHDEEELIKDLILDIGKWKNNLFNRGEFIPKTLESSEFKRVLDSYENFKVDHGKIDFDDMLTKCYDLLRARPGVLEHVRNQYQYILIDEFQDINGVQFETIKLMAEPLQNLFVVGDDDQSIYSFRGANPQIILNFHDIYPKAQKITLNMNYRSQENIIKSANQLIKQNKCRVEKQIIPTVKANSEIQYSEPKNREEENRTICQFIELLMSEGYSYKDIAIIYRTNLLAGSLVDSLLDRNIPFVSRDHIYNVFEHWIAKDIIAYLKGAFNYYDYDSLMRIINRPTRYITKNAMRKAQTYHKDFITALKVKGELMPYQNKNIADLSYHLNNIKYLTTKEAIKYIRKDIGYDRHIENYCAEKRIRCEGLIETLNELEEASSRHEKIDGFLTHIKDMKSSLSQKSFHRTEEEQVELLTMHSAKGLEYKVVIILGAIEGVIPHHKSMDTLEDIEEERRLFYVAMTRAKERLYISSSLIRYEKPTEPSRFINEIRQNDNKKGSFVIGQEVEHKTFGKGLIEQISEKIMKVRFYRIKQVKPLDIDTCIHHKIVK
ncbi:UvrD/REP helicase [Alkaliphilus metalliredigens QYMF]|uniref:DNA 3'-5' helicase n=1 Tax=Alkaliphilus metalliredigens (strain QYMF) TaxID=293826 RepID=A6TQ92_ALKMQ|nr:ATP-dependent helicase [Alkaliphilus metalliredigens]ABR48360.1 UvrD/REP helicase [Alkaliphilus metalliredigens QYMF]